MKSHLTEVREMIEAGLRNAKPEEAPGPEEPDLEWNSTVGRVLDPANPSNSGHLFTPVVEHVDITGFVDDGAGYTDDEGIVHTVLHGREIAGTPFHAVENRESCPWVCPVTCLECTVKNCADRLAGGVDEIP